MFVNRALSGLACLEELLSFCPDSEKQRSQCLLQNLISKVVNRAPLCRFVIVFNFYFKHAFIIFKT